MTTKTTLGVVDAEVLDRANHTGEQPISTVTNLQSELDSLQTTIDNFNIESGSWSPTITLVANAASAATGGDNYFRIGNIVHCFGFIQVDTNGNAACRVDISLPVASDLTGSGQLRGVFNTQTTQNGGAIYSNTTSDLARFDFLAQAADSYTFSYSFDYVVA